MKKDIQLDVMYKAERDRREHEVALRISNRIRHLREDVYNIKQKKFAEDIEKLSRKNSLVSDAGTEDARELVKWGTVKGYDSGKTLAPVTVLMLICEYFSGMPDKNGNYHKITLDYLTGREEFYNPDTKYINSVTGLSQQAIENLIHAKKLDEEFKRLNALNMIVNKEKPLVSVASRLRLPFINFFLTSELIRKFTEVFWRYAWPDDFNVPVYRDGDDFKPVPGELCMASEDNLDDNIPLDLSGTYKRAIAKNEMDILLADAADEYREYFKEQGYNTIFPNTLLNVDEKTLKQWKKHLKRR